MVGRTVGAPREKGNSFYHVVRRGRGEEGGVTRMNTDGLHHHSRPPLVIPAKAGIQFFGIKVRGPFNSKPYDIDNKRKFG